MVPAWARGYARCASGYASASGRALGLGEEFFQTLALSGRWTGGLDQFPIHSDFDRMIIHIQALNCRPLRNIAREMHRQRIFIVGKNLGVV
jgi:hypothetical protein